jgi:hypothetical protein
MWNYSCLPIFLLLLSWMPSIWGDCSSRTH